MQGSLCQMSSGVEEGIGLREHGRGNRDAVFVDIKSIIMDADEVSTSYLLLYVLILVRLLSAQMPRYPSMLSTGTVTQYTNQVLDYASLTAVCRDDTTSWRQHVTIDELLELS